MKKTIFLCFILSFLILSISCSKDKECATIPSVSGICIDSTQIDPTLLCPTVWEPVCGCDGVTYSNDCFASINGVQSVSEGACCD